MGASVRNRRARLRRERCRDRTLRRAVAGQGSDRRLGQGERPAQDRRHTGDARQLRRASRLVRRVLQGEQDGCRRNRAHGLHRGGENPP